MSTTRIPAVTLIHSGPISEALHDSVRRVYAAVDAPVDWREVVGGAEAVQQGKPACPPELIASARETGIVLKPLLKTPVGVGYGSPNLQLRKELGVFAGVRPIRSLSGVASRYQNVNILLVRELTEGTYSGIEHEIIPGVMETIKVTTADKCKRIVEYAFDLARRKKRKRVTLVHKANIMKQSDGMFVRIGKEVAERNNDIEFRDIIIDNCSMQLVAKPEQFDVMVADNMFGDILSDIGAGLVGSPLLVPSINIGDGVRIYEATHHLRYEQREDGQAIADPLVLLVPAAHLLDHLGYPVARKRLEAAMAKVAVAHQTLTPDLGGRASTKEMTDAIIAALPPASAIEV